MQPSALSFVVITCCCSRAVLSESVVGWLLAVGLLVAGLYGVACCWLPSGWAFLVFSRSHSGGEGGGGSLQQLLHWQVAGGSQFRSSSASASNQPRIQLRILSQFSPLQQPPCASTSAREKLDIRQTTLQHLLSYLFILQSSISCGHFILSGS